MSSIERSPTVYAFKLRPESTDPILRPTFFIQQPQVLLNFFFPFCFCFINKSRFKITWDMIDGHCLLIISNSVLYTSVYSKFWDILVRKFFLKYTISVKFCRWYLIFKSVRPFFLSL